MNGKELLDYLNKEAVITTDAGLRIDVRITDVKSAYGRTRYQVTPLAGSGETWVESVVLKEAV